MSCFGYSDNYVWITTSALGQGGFGSVYLGIHEKTGEEVAVKTFEKHAHKKGIPVKEFEVMKYLYHENIVKMIALEDERGMERTIKRRKSRAPLYGTSDVDTASTISYASPHDTNEDEYVPEVQVQKKKVLIMELCRGGNLQKVLEDPQNINGLEEEEFLCVLKDITAGREYLREKNIVHRDFKPGNIMKYISEDGRCIYKVADFGSARYLEDDQQFKSNHGTEEYKHPVLYNDQYLCQRGEKAYKATVELWSIGVTIYQMATGSLPFRPYGGRQNRKTMHSIHMSKQSGFISGIQYGENQSIKWSKELPETCLLNNELRKLVTSLLAGLLERDEEKMWTFDQFFESVQDIISRKIFHVFYVNEGKEVSLYMQPDKMLQDLKEEISAHTEVRLSSQLLFDKSLFLPQIDSSSDVSQFPTTALDKPLILVHMENIGIVDLTSLETVSSFTPEFSSKSVNVDSSEVNVDASEALKCCSKAYAVKRLVVKLVRCQELLLQMPKILMSLPDEYISRLCSDLRVLKLKIDAVIDKSELLEKISSVVLEITRENNDDNVRNICERIERDVSEKKKSVDEVKKKFAELESSTDRMKKLVSKDLQCEQTLSECASLDRCVELANTYVEKIRDSWQQVFFRHKVNRELSAKDRKIHMLGRLRMKNMNSKLYTLLDECRNVHLQTLRKLNGCYSDVQTIMTRCRNFGEDLHSVTDDLAKCSSSLQEFESKLFEHATQIVTANTSFERYTEQDKEIIAEIKTVQKGQLDLGEVTEENKHLIEKFVSLLQNTHEEFNKLKE